MQIIEWLRQQLKLAQAQGALRRLPIVDASNFPIVIRDNRTFIDFTSTDCLSLGRHPALLRSAVQTIDSQGLSGRSSRAMTGTSTVHEHAEQALARFFATESALLFSSRNQAALSLVVALADEKTTLYIDSASSTPYVDAARIVDADVKLVDVRGLALFADEPTLGPLQAKKLILTDAISGVDGRAVDLPALITQARRIGATLVVDETNAVGAVGVRGSGLREAQGVPHECRIVICSLSHAVPGAGAAVCGPRELIEYIAARSRTFANEVAPMPLVAAVVRDALGLIELARAEREILETLRERLLAGLRSLRLIPAHTGYDAACVGISYGAGAEARTHAQGLAERRHLVEVVSQNQPRSDASTIKVSLTSAHSQEQIDRLLEAYAEIVRR